MLERMVTNIENLTAPEFTRGAVKFHIDKMPALAAWTLLDKTRRELAAQTDAQDATSLAHSAAVFVKGVMLLPHAFVEELRQELFEHIRFQGGAVAKGWADLAGMEDTAFQDQEGDIVYELIIRSLVVNFEKSCKRVVRDSGLLDLVSALKNAVSYPASSQDRSAPESASTGTSTN